MTKNEEIKYLTKVVADLGSDSYTGRWLEEQLPAIAQAITDDVEAGVYAVSLKEVQKEAERVIGYARQKACLIVGEAELQASAIRKVADAWMNHSQAVKQAVDAAQKLIASVR